MYKITAKYFIHWRNQGEKVFNVVDDAWFNLFERSCFGGCACCGNNAANAVQRPFSERLNKAAAEENGAKAAVLYVNNANTTYDADIDRAVLETCRQH